MYLYLSAPALWCYSVVECIKRYLLSQARFVGLQPPSTITTLATRLAQRAPRAAKESAPAPLHTAALLQRHGIEK